MDQHASGHHRSRRTVPILLTAIRASETGLSPILGSKESDESTDLCAAQCAIFPPELFRSSKLPGSRLKGGFVKSSTSLIAARPEAEEGQAANRAWWSALPMTYKDWDMADRTPDPQKIVSAFLGGNPYLQPRHFAMPEKKVLEIGCGAGAATILFHQAGAKITAIDLTQVGVSLTRKHCPEAEVLEMDAENMSFADATFDHVFSWGVIHHSAYTENVLNEIARVLKPKGTGLIMIYNRNSLRYWVKGFRWLFIKGKIFKGENLSSVQKYYTDGYFHRHFSPSEFRKGLESRGLKVEAMRMTHMAKQMVPFVPRSVDDYCKARWGWLLVAEICKN
jgi:ubiquinone/menaquinone biosynthesis C-methylase UbiE